MKKKQTSFPYISDIQLKFQHFFPHFGVILIYFVKLGYKYFILF